MKEFIGKTGKEIEEHFGFDFYLETKDDFIFGRGVDDKKLMDSFIRFNKETELKLFQLYDGIIQKIEDIDLNDVKKNLLLLAENGGMFYDDSNDELATSYGFLCDDYFAEVMPGIIFFSGKEEYVKNFSDILKENGIECHEIEKISEIGKKVSKKIHLEMKKLKKLGRNELCRCGSGIKYKKCCMNTDIKENGKARRADSLWGKGSFAETISPEDIEEKEKTISKGHNEDMNFNCKKCDEKISAHNKDWHDNMCDGCFNKTYHS